MATKETLNLKLNAEGNIDVLVGTKKVGVVRVHGPRK